MQELVIGRIVQDGPQRLQQEAPLQAVSPNGLRRILRLRVVHVRISLLAPRVCSSFISFTSGEVGVQVGPQRALQAELLDELQRPPKLRGRRVWVALEEFLVPLHERAVRGALVLHEEVVRLQGLCSLCVALQRPDLVGDAVGGPAEADHAGVYAVALGSSLHRPAVHVQGSQGLHDAGIELAERPRNCGNGGDAAVAPAGGFAGSAVTQRVMRTSKSARVDVLHVPGLHGMASRADGPGTPLAPLLHHGGIVGQVGGRQARVVGGRVAHMCLDTLCHPMSPEMA